MKKRLFPMVILAGLVVLAMLPAEAAGVIPTFVGGNSNCDTVSSATFSLTIVEPVGDSTHSLPGVPGATIELSNVGRRAFDFTASGATIHDVIVKGSGSNWYHYDPSVGSDTDLVIPNGNKLNLVHFCYEAVPGTPLECGGVVSVSNEDDSVTGAFTRVGGDCEADKLVEIEVTEADEIVFIPRGSGDASYTGVLTFEKTAADPSALVLQYDPDDDGDAPYKDVPDCAGTTENPTLPGGDTWCVVTASADYLGGSLWKMTWNVYGEGDPRFK